jgi:hypothetical protein
LCRTPRCGQALGTGSDVYSLGVILFELVTVHRPYRIRTRLMREIERIVREALPMVLSTVVAKPSESIVVETSANGQSRDVSRFVSRDVSRFVSRIQRFRCG